MLPEFDVARSRKKSGGADDSVFKSLARIRLVYICVSFSLLL